MVFAYSQRSTKTFERAVDIILKVIKTMGNDREVRNPSGYLHSCVINARFYD